MTINQKPTGTAVSIPKGLALGVLMSACITLLGVLLTAWMIDREFLEWKHSGYAVMVILIVSSWMAAMTSSVKVKRKKILMCMVSGGTYFLFLILFTALFFNGKYSGVGETLLLIICGSMLAVITNNPGNQRKRRVKIR